MVEPVPDSSIDQPPDSTSVPVPESRGHLVAVAVGVLGILGGMVLATVAFVTTEVDVDDLLDSLYPVRIPALLLLTVSFVAPLFLAGRAWARWVLALILAGGSVWILTFMEISGPWLKVAVGIAIAWGLCAITLVASRRVARYTESMANHWMVTYERLIGPLRDDDDARRWLAMFDTWESTGVLTQGDRRRIARALTSWSKRTEPHADDVATRIKQLSATTGDFRLMSLAQRATKRRRPTE